MAGHCPFPHVGHPAARPAGGATALGVPTRSTCAPTPWQTASPVSFSSAWMRAVHLPFCWPVGSSIYPTSMQGSASGTTVTLWTMPAGAGTGGRHQGHSPLPTGRAVPSSRPRLARSNAGSPSATASMPPTGEGAFIRGDIHHGIWPLQPAEAEIRQIHWHRLLVSHYQMCRHCSTSPRGRKY